MFRMLFGMFLGLLMIPVVVLVWMNFGNVPVAVADRPFPYERQITHTLLNARIGKEMVQNVPIAADNAAFAAGAHIYADKCAFCHGWPGRPSAVGDDMYPHAPQLWEHHRNNGAVGVSDDAPGETYWKTANGIRLTGMPSFNNQLSTDQIWQVSVLLANANKPAAESAIGAVHGAGARP